MRVRKPLVLILFLIGCSTSKVSWDPLQTVPYVDINRFMGDWYVIANIPTFIEKRATNAMESYKLNNKGEIETTFSSSLIPLRRFLMTPFTISTR